VNVGIEVQAAWLALLAQRTRSFQVSEGDPLSGLERETGVEPATLSLGMRTRARLPLPSAEGNGVMLRGDHAR